jgi:hypothetical protein
LTRANILGGLTRRYQEQFLRIIGITHGNKDTNASKNHVHRRKHLKNG